MSLSEALTYIQGVLNQDRRAIAKAITLIESSLPAHQDITHEILDAILPYTGKAIRLGVTGIPGAGESTFIDSFGAMLTHQGYHVAVLAVDDRASSDRRRRGEPSGTSPEKRGKRCFCARPPVLMWSSSKQWGWASRKWPSLPWWISFWFL